MINIILAQSFGIAAAQELTFTPFSNIITYLNISDDLAAGNSRFVAEAKRARNLLDVLNKVNNSDKFSIMAADELFNGTTYKEGQAAAYSLIKQLGSSKNNICIACTHFPKLTELEERTAHFANYKVAVNYDDEGKINYPYTLTRGTTDQIVTFDILKEEGFGDTFLTEAKNMLIKKNHVITSFDRKNL